MSMVPTRRRFLAGFSALSAVAGGTALTIAAKADPVADAELLALDGEIMAALARYDACCEAKARCVAHFRTIEPPIPEAIIAKAWNGVVETEWPPSIDGAPCSKDVSNRTRIMSRYGLERRIEETDGRTRLGKLYRLLKKEVDAFHEAHTKARQESGIPEAETRRYMAGRELHDLGLKVDEIEATTLQGLAVKGRAGLAKHKPSFAENGLWLHPSHRKLLENLASLGLARSV